MDMSGSEVAGHGGLVKRQLLGDLLGMPKSLLDNLLNPQRTTTSDEAPPAQTTTSQAPPPPPPTTTSPEPQQQPTTLPPPPPPPPPPSPSPTPVSTPTPAPAPPPASSRPAPSPSPPPLPTTTSQPPKPAPTPIPGRFSNILPAQPSAIVSKPTPEEAHQSLPALIPLPTQDAEVLPGVTSISPSSSSRQNILPTSGPGEPQEKGAIGKEPDSGMAFTQRLGLGIGLALLMVILVVAGVFICRWRRRICKKRKQDAIIASTSYPPDLKATIAAPQPVLDPEIGIGNIHEQKSFFDTEERPTLPSMRQYDSSQYDRQESTAAWARKLQEPSSPVESEKETETGIIRIFRWPTIASRSEITAMTKRGWAARSSGQQSKDVSGTSSWTSRASRSTLSTILWRSRRSIARRLGDDGDDPAADEEETGILRDAQPAPLRVDRKPVPVRDPTPQPLTPRREKSRRTRRESAMTVSSAGGGSIASSGVLSPTLMAFPVPPKGASSLSLVLTSNEPLPPLPATVYKPYRA